MPDAAGSGSELPSRDLPLGNATGGMYPVGVMSKLTLSLQALRTWRGRQWLVAVGASVATAVVLGLVTVLIPNPVFGREVPPTAWSYPVWIATSVLTGVLFATYVRPRDAAGVAEPAAAAALESGAGAGPQAEQKTSWLGMAGTITGWFAIGCPVCNKIALIALGYSGALTYFAPIQPWLAVLALVLLVVSLMYRLSGQIACPMPRRA